MKNYFLSDKIINVMNVVINNSKDKVSETNTVLTQINTSFDQLFF